MIISYMLAALISSSGDPEMISDVCAQPSWPAHFEVSQTVTFAKLQDLYLREVPEALMPQEAILRAESVARGRSPGNWEAQAKIIGSALYQAQLQQLEVRCGPYLDDQYGAVGLIEQAYARVLAHTNLRHDSVAAGKLLPEEFSDNLTPRVAIIGLSVHCSRSTPALASFLAHVSIPCGQPA